MTFRDDAIEAVEYDLRHDRSAYVWESSRGETIFETQEVAEEAVRIILATIPEGCLLGRDGTVVRVLGPQDVPNEYEMTGGPKGTEWHMVLIPVSEEE